MSAKTVVVTGASDGIGAAAARALRRDGHTVVVVGRSPDKTRRVADALGAEHHVADFADLAEVRALAATVAERHPRIDVLANNAGGVFGRRDKTVDGHELTFQVNHLAPFLLTHLLLPVLERSGATVVQTSSLAARLYGNLDLDDLDNDRRFSATKAYGDAKLANILMTRELDRRYRDRGVHAVAFHPGFIGSGFGGDTTSLAMRMVYNPITRRFLASSEKGADQLVWLAESDAGVAWEPGGYYEKRHLARHPNRQADDAELARGLWERSAQLVGVPVT